VVLNEATTGVGNNPIISGTYYPSTTAACTNTSTGTWIALGDGSPILSALAGISTNTLTVGSTGVTNNTSYNYLLTITAGTGLALKDPNGNQFATPVLGETVPLKPGWRFTGTTVTAQCYQQ
jgi:hypothetical protein